MRLTTVAIATGTLLVATVLTGCGTTSECVDYIALDSPAAMAKEAQLVVTGHQIGTTDDVTAYGEQAHVHLVRIDSVLKGKATVGKTLSVVSTPATCTEGAPYPNGDQVNVFGEAEYFLYDDGKRVSTLTPDAGVERIDGVSLPWAP